MFFPKCFSKVNVPIWFYLCLFSMTSFFDYQGIELKFVQYVHLVFICFFIYDSFLKHREKVFDKSFYRLIILMAFLPLLSVIPAYLLHGQAVTDTLVVHRMHLGWLIFFVLNNRSFSEKQIFKGMFMIGMVSTFIFLAEQITYPYTPFGLRGAMAQDVIDSGRGVERRFGFYRLFVSGSEFLAPLFFLSIANVIKVKKWVLVMMVVAFLGTGTRTILASMAVSFSYLLLSDRNIKHRNLLITLSLFVGAIVYLNFNGIFGRLANVSDAYEYGREHSYIYYFAEYIRNPLSILLGNGLPRGDSFETVYINYKPVVITDIGIVANLYLWGLIYVATMFGFIIYFLFSPRLDKPYKAYLIMKICEAPVLLPVWEIASTTLWGIFFYLCYLNIQSKHKYSTNMLATNKYQYGNNK